MADDFRKPRNIDWEPAPQASDPKETASKPLTEEFESEEDLSSRAGTIVEENNRTIEFHKFIEGLLRELSTVEVEFDPQEDPEVWMAMQRIFSNPSPKANQNAYFQVLDAIEAMNKVELAEEDPRNDLEEDFLSNLPNAQEVDEAEINDEAFQETALDEIEQKGKVRRASAIVETPPPQKGPYRRRWRRILQRIGVLDKKFTVVWLKNRPKDFRKD